jgi:hypothetical protein
MNLEMSLLNNLQDSVHREQGNPNLTSDHNAPQNPLTDSALSENETAATVATETNGSTKSKEYIPHTRISAVALNFSKRSLDEKTLLVDGISVIIFLFNKSDLKVLDGVEQDNENLDLRNRICYGLPTEEDLLEAQTHHDNGKWVFPISFRMALYTMLFDPMVEGNHWIEWNSVVVRRNVEVLRDLQGFLLQSMNWLLICEITTSTNLPNLQSFVLDVFDLIQILITPTPKLSPEYAKTHPLFQLICRLEDWRKRWGEQIPDTMKSNESRNGYVVALCDAIFGVHTGKDLYERPTFEHTNLWSLLSTDMAQSHIPISDFKLLDAGYIERHGPYRFITTTRLDQHLTVEGHTIFYYADWKKWTFLSRHNVLRRACEVNRSGNHVSFDTLVNKNRMRTGEPHYSSGLMGISQDILVTNILCFHRDTLFTEKRSRVRSLLTYIGISNNATTSWQVGRRMGVDLEDDVVQGLAKAFVGVHAEDWSSLFDACLPFRERQRKLQNVLREWRPRTIWEMRYPGYGGVDPVGLYAFYFATFLGIITIVGVGVSAAQTYAAFKAIPISTG